MKLRLLILSCICSLATLAQNDFPYGKIRVRNFSVKEYSATAQNWDIIQNSDYFFYIANNGGILEYNGENWTKLEMDNSEHPRSFDKNDSGLVFVGGRGEFGYIDYNELGKTSYKKISHQVDSLDFSDIWKVFCLGEHTYFVSTDYVFIYYQDNIEVIQVPATERIETSIHLNELIICSFEGEGQEGDRSFVLRGNKFFEIQNSLHIHPIIIFEEGQKKIMIDNQGNFHEFQQNGSAYQYVKLTDRKLDIGEGSKINDINIQKNMLVVGTAGNGVMIFNLKGELIRTFMERDGLENLEIRKIYFDQYHNIWLCNDNGITFIETSDAMTSFDKDFGITGITEDIYLKNGQIYLATHTDIYGSNFKPGELTFENKSIFGMEVYQVKDFKFSDNSTYTFVIANDGVYYLDENMQKKLIDDIYAWDMHQSEVDRNRILFGLDGDGIGSIYYSNGKFTYEGNYPNTSGEVRSVVELEGKVYYSVKKDGIHLLDTTRAQEKNRLNGLKGDAGTVYSQFTLCVFQGEVYAGTTNGLYKVVGNELKPSDLNDGEFAKEHLLIHRLFNDNNERFWMVVFHNADSKDEYSEVGYFEKIDGKMVWNSAAFQQITDDVIHTIKRRKDGVYWFGGGRKVYAYNSSYTPNFDMPFNAYIYEVSLNEDSTLVYNSHYAAETEQVIAYKFNSVRFNFTTSAYLGGIENQYSYYLEGFDSTWGKWKTANTAEYQRLGEGSYTFHVKAMNYYGYESEPVSFSFTITPPWYRTIWAYLIYFLLFILLIYVIIRLAIRRVKLQKEELEKIVKERTHEIAEQNQLLEHQKAEIEEKTNDILDSIKYAKRIQNTILPGEDKLNNIFNHDHFVLYKPKDIVSGDFYWAARFENKTIFSAIDCTGHGVPGAFVSIVGFNALNRTVNEFKLREPAAILDKLTELVVNTFTQSESMIKDGMDIGLCAIDNTTLKLEFSGANNPCVVVRKGEAIELTPDKQPIGEFEARKPFTNHEFQLETGDCVYVLSDGYADQFGGPKGKKLKFKALRDLLIEVSEMDMKTQLKRLDDAFMEWKGDYEQLDDVCLFGVKIK